MAGRGLAAKLFRIPLRDPWGKQNPLPRTPGRGFLDVHSQLPIPTKLVTLRLLALCLAYYYVYAIFGAE